MAGVAKQGDGWRREDRRLFAGALNGIVFFLALAIVLRRVDWEFIREVKVWATTLQFVGALVASGGLLYAYCRATRPIPVVVRPGPAHLYLFGGSAFGTAPFRLDRTASPEAQLVQLEDFVNGVLVANCSRLLVGGCVLCLCFGRSA